LSKAFVNIPTPGLVALEVSGYERTEVRMVMGLVLVKLD